ncbi:MAG: hypothetical protein GYA56_10505, partial [Geobacteraceae bacterium]|nr:hypothetical protein [Geobacteraceae bacterium]
MKLMTKLVSEITVVTARFIGRQCLSGAGYLYHHRKQIWQGARMGSLAFASSVRGAASFVYDAASLRIFDKERVEEMRKRIEEQGTRYRGLVIAHMENHRLVDSLSLGGDLLADIIRTGRIPADVQAAYTAAYPGLAFRKTFAEAAQSYDGHELTGFIS